MLVQTPPTSYGMGTGSMQGTGTPMDGTKRTFKAKLQGLVQEAEYQEQQAQREASMQDKKSLSIALLVEGRPSAFCDFFRLTHNDTTSTSGVEQDLPIESLLLLKSQLVKADEAQRAGRAEEVYGSYKALAKYFAQMGNLRTAEFFFHRGLNVAHDANWVPGELEANLALGVVYEELQDTRSAIICHERRLELAGQNMMAQDMEVAYASLTKVYKGQAEKLEKAGDLVGSLDSYAKCLTAAERAGDSKVQAEAHYRTGMLLFQRGKWHDAIFHLRQYLDRASALMDLMAEGVAITTLAQCLKEINDPSQATETLENYLENAQRGQEQTGPAIACCSLGTLYFEQQDYARAVTHFEKFFEISRQLSDRRISDTARFNLGVARGALRMAAYMGIVDGDLLKLLRFKNARAEFDLEMA
eukprot:gene16810-23091_t